MLIYYSPSRFSYDIFGGSILSSHTNSTDTALWLSSVMIAWPSFYCSLNILSIDLLLISNAICLISRNHAGNVGSYLVCMVKTVYRFVPAVRNAWCRPYTGSYLQLAISLDPSLLLSNPNKIKALWSGVGGYFTLLSIESNLIGSYNSLKAED